VIDKQYYVYLMTTAKNTALYTGVTNDLLRRIYEHKNNIVEGFTRRYKVYKLVYYEAGKDVLAAIDREKQIKSWKRVKKLALTNSFNPDWRDLYEDLI
jgi:putative endonuclease